MENFNINGNVIAPKFNFAFSKEIEKRLASKEDTGFNNLIYGLLDEDPDTLITAIYSSFASLTGVVRPSEDQIVDALTNDLVDDAKAHGLFLDIVKEIVANGFLFLKLKKFRKNLNEIIELGNERLAKLSNDGQSLSDPLEVSNNKEQVEQVESGMKGIQKVLTDLETLIQEAQEQTENSQITPNA